MHDIGFFRQQSVKQYKIWKVEHAHISWNQLIKKKGEARHKKQHPAFQSLAVEPSKVPKNKDLFFGL